ncbi:DMT family transporter [uncultured Sphingomonas sp.]
MIPIIVVIVAGLGLPIQPHINAALARAAGSVWLPGLLSYTFETAPLIFV